MVKGDLDLVWNKNTSLRDYEVFQAESWSIGLIHGHQILPHGQPDALAMYANRLGVDLLISGHTYEWDVYASERTIFLNPGSTTGAIRFPHQTRVVPSFMLLNLQKELIIVYIYQLIDGEIQVEQRELPKPRRSVS
jgi:vacuolar protein sorting-associated protein 29